MPRYLLGVLLLLLVSVSEMQAQGDVVLYIEGKPVYRSEFEYYYRKAPEQTPEAYLPAFINYKLKVRYAMDSGLDTVSAFRRQLSFYRMWWMPVWRNRKPVLFMNGTNSDFKRMIG